MNFVMQLREGEELKCREEDKTKKAAQHIEDMKNKASTLAILLLNITCITHDINSIYLSIYLPFLSSHPSIFIK